MPVHFEREFNPIVSALGGLLGQSSNNTQMPLYGKATSSALGIKSAAYETFGLFESLPNTDVFITTFSKGKTANGKTSFHAYHKDNKYNLDINQNLLSHLGRTSRFEIRVSIRASENYSHGQIFQLLNHELHLHAVSFALAVYRLHFEEPVKSFDTIWMETVSTEEMQHARFVTKAEKPDVALRCYLRARARLHFWSNELKEGDRWTEYANQEINELQSTFTGLISAQSEAAQDVPALKTCLERWQQAPTEAELDWCHGEMLDWATQEPANASN